MRKVNTGPFVLVWKLGAKLLPLVYQLKASVFSLLKSASGLKAAGAIASAGLYSYLFTWQMGVALVAFIGIHEYGHIWAMHRCGVRTRGMFFIPGFGAVAIADEKFGSAANEAYIALMGPIWGLVFFVLPTAFVYAISGAEQLAAIAAFTAFVNLVNLFPVNPLDGGRVLKAVAYAKRYSASFIVLGLVSLSGFVLGALSGFYLLGVLAIVGFAEIAMDFGVMRYFRSFLTTLARIFVGLLAVVCYAFFVGMGRHSLFANLGMSLLALLLTILLLGDIRSLTVDQGRWIITYPICVIKEAFSGIAQIFTKKWKVKPIENYERLSVVGRSGYALAFVALISVHVLFIGLISTTSGARFVPSLLK